MLHTYWIAVVLAVTQRVAWALSTVKVNDPHVNTPRHVIYGRPPSRCIHHICPDEKVQTPKKSEYAPTRRVRGQNLQNPEASLLSKGTPLNCEGRDPSSCVSHKPHFVQTVPSTSFPGTHQTAPVTCGNGKPPPCNVTTSFPGTHQTAPVTCGNGKPPPCNVTTSFPGTHQTAPVTCGNGKPPPCNVTTSFPGTHQSAPVTCGDGKPPPCNVAVTFPGTHQTAPVTCGDGNRLPCH